MLLTDQLTLMRSQAEDMMPDTCDILSVTNTSDSQGGIVQTWGTASASVKCRLDAQGGGDALSAGRITDFRGYILTVPYATTVTEANRVLHGGVTYAVTSVDLDKSWPVTRRAKLERV